MIAMRELKSGYFALILFSLLAIVLPAGNVTYGAGGIAKMNTYEKGLLDRINRYRVSNGLHSLTADATLQALAGSHSRNMRKAKILSHDAFQERFEKCGRSHCVENVGWNSPTPEAQFESWKASTGHNANLLNKKIRFAGIAKDGPFVAFFACD